jgi:hypothetical protein
MSTSCCTLDGVGTFAKKEVGEEKEAKIGHW